MAKCQRAIKLLRTGELETQQHFKIILHDGGDFKHSHETRRSWSCFFHLVIEKTIGINVIANFVLNKIVLNFFFFFCQDEYRSCWPKFENSADFILGFACPQVSTEVRMAETWGFLTIPKESYQKFMTPRAFARRTPSSCLY